MTCATLSRRRFLSISAALAAGASLGTAARAAEARWQGHALGAHASLRIIGLSEAEAEPILAAVEAELRRLEAIFSLHAAESELVRLNRDGVLDAPSAELLEVLSIAAEVHDQTGGLFDPTVQPVFRHYVEGGGDLHDALSLVGFDRVAVSRQRISLPVRGMALTLNGVAQGYITDRIAALLRAGGLAEVLVDIGEIAAIGSGPEGGGWRVGLATPDGRVQEVLRVSDRAVATSSPLGTLLDPAGRVGHILHPLKGAVPGRHGRITVLHDSAALADAFSTAGVLLSDGEIAALRSRGLELRTG